MPITLAQVEEHKKGLDDEQKKKWLKIYNSAFAACQAAGVEDEKECHTSALRIASSRVDNRPLALRADGIYEGEWPGPGVGAPRNPYGGFSSLEYPDGKSDWLLAWKAHFAQVKDAKVFSNISEWLWAVESALELTLPDGLYDVAPREEDLSEANILSTPEDYGLTSWKDRPEGMSVLDVTLPGELELYDLHRAYWAERKRKEIDGLLSVQDRGDAQLRQSFGEARVVRYDEDTGLLVADVPIAKLTVLPYLDSTGQVVHELKHPRDFASPAFLATIPGKPIVDGHAPGGIPYDELDEEGRARYTCGFTHTAPGSVWVEDSLIYAREVVFDEQLIAGIRSGEKVQVSTGIWSLVTDEEGVYDGVAYQRRQTKPMLDHLAHVAQGRCGPECAVVLDGAIEISESTNEEGGNGMEEKESKNEQTTTLELKLDEATIALCPDAKAEDVTAFQAAIDAVIQAKTDALTKVTELTTQLDAAKGEGDGKDVVIKTLQGELKTVQEAQTKFDEGLDTRLDERIDMIAFMRELDPEYDHRTKTVQDMRVDALKHFDETFEPKDLSEDYVKASFDTVQKFLEKQRKDPTGVFDLRAPRGDEGDEDEAQKRVDARTTGLYRDPLKQGKTALVEGVSFLRPRAPGTEKD